MTTNRQQGVVLAVVLMMILIISVLAVSAMQASIFDTRIAINRQHKSLAFMAAENALMHALRSDNPSDIVPNSTQAGATKVSDPLFTLQQTSTTPAISAKLTAIYKQKLSSDISGYQVNADILLYELTAQGEVSGASQIPVSRAVNKMGVAYITPKQ